MNLRDVTDRRYATDPMNLEQEPARPRDIRSSGGFCITANFRNDCALRPFLRELFHYCIFDLFDIVIFFGIDCCSEKKRVFLHYIENSVPLFVLLRVFVRYDYQERG